MPVRNKSKRLLIIGIIGCLLYVIGDFLFAATGKGQTTESIGFMVRVADLEMGTWRMVASIFCGFIGTLLYYMGFHRSFREEMVGVLGFSESAATETEKKALLK